MKNIKKDIDIAMTFVLLFLMSYYYSNNIFHEVLGVIITVLFLIHNILNNRWYKAFFKGKYKVVRIVKTLINTGMLVCFITTIVSGILISKELFTFIPLTDYVMNARILHNASSRWLFILISVHIGLHLSLMIQNIKIPKSIAIISAICIFSVGIYSFIDYDFMNLMLLKQKYTYFDTSKSYVLFLIQHISIMSSLALLSYFIQHRRSLINVKKEDKKHEKSDVSTTKTD